MSQFRPSELMESLGAISGTHWTHAGQTYESIGWIGDPVFTEEQFNTKKAELLQTNPIPEPE